MNRIAAATKSSRNARSYSPANSVSSAGRCNRRCRMGILATAIPQALTSFGRRSFPTHKHLTLQFTSG
jgi:hypothetical protein